MRPSGSKFLAVVFCTGLVGSPAMGAQEEQPVPRGGPCPTTPAAVSGVVFDSQSTLSWDADTCTSRFNVYRGRLSETGKCHASDLTATTFDTPGAPDSEEGFFYLVTGEALEEGTPGSTSGGMRRALLGRCDTVLRNHVLDHAGYGWDEWSRDQITSLGLQGFVDEQLDPATIDEASNATLATRLTDIEPPETIQELQAVDVVKAVYARRQLEQSATLFWVNHFNTDWQKTFMYFTFFTADPARRNLETTKLHYDEMEVFRGLAFSGSFRDMVEASAFSPAMIIYLDTLSNIASAPNENYARELLELHTMGVAGGYSQDDVEELARVFTGWEVCRKAAADLNDPLAPCINPLLNEGGVVAHFNSANHDCGAKVLFPDDIDNRIDFPDTCATPVDGINDVTLALDGIVAHPSTRRFLIGKLLEKYLVEAPSQALIDAIKVEWDDAAHPAGVGDLTEVLRAVLDLSRLGGPDLVGEKIKTPFEHTASVFRGTRGITDGNESVRGYLTRMQHLLHQNPIPTGYPEPGGEWIDTNNTLERQNLGVAVAKGITNPDFGSDVLGLLNDNGVTTAPGNSEAIVDFLIDAFFGGALDPVERQKVLDFLNTNNSGVPGNYNDTRIRQTAGFMMGLGPFQEQ